MYIISLPANSAIYLEISPCLQLNCTHCPKELGSFQDIDGNVTAKKLYT